MGWKAASYQSLSVPSYLLAVRSSSVMLPMYFWYSMYSWADGSHGAGEVALALDAVTDHDGLIEEFGILREDDVEHGLVDRGKTLYINQIPEFCEFCNLF